MNNLNKSLISVFALSLFASSANADVKPVLKFTPVKKIQFTKLPMNKISKDEMSKIKVIQNDLNSKIALGFKNNIKLKAQMEAEAKAISKIKDKAALNKAMVAYQAKYRSQYEQILKLNGVDLNQYSKKMAAVAPKYDFIISPNLSFIAKNKDNLKTINSSEPVNNNPPPAQVTSVALDLGDFEKEISATCGQVATNYSNATSGSINTAATAIVAGGCASEVQAETYIEVPRDKDIILKLEVSNLNSQTWTFGLVGGGSADASSRVTIINPRGDEIFKREVESYCFSIFLWNCYSEDELLDLNKNIDLKTTGEYRLIFESNTGAYSFVGDGDAKAGIHGIKIKYDIINEN